VRLNCKMILNYLFLLTREEKELVRDDCICLLSFNRSRNLILIVRIYMVKSHYILSSCFFRLQFHFRIVSISILFIIQRTHDSNKYKSRWKYDLALLEVANHVLVFWAYLYSSLVPLADTFICLWAGLTSQFLVHN
jgi:hypothetical protein